jgi:low temperature requirement protein LtrA
MSDSPAAPRRHRPWAAPLSARSPAEPHRAATPLELFFDLVIVVAVARGAAALHHALAEGHVADGLASYAMVFFGIWWAWVNFTWFASAYDNDDLVYRLLVLVQLTGALVFAAGIPAFAHGDWTVGVLGYVLMRLALVSLWLRAGRADEPRRRSTRRYALGVSCVQVAWLLSLLVPHALALPTFWLLAACELLVPAWAEAARQTSWHPHHIAERYGLFTIITLGESILAASNALQSAFAGGATAAELLGTIVGGLLIVFSCWWLYFEHPGHEVLRTRAQAFLWGYGHYFVFAAVAAVGAGLSVEVDRTLQRATISEALAGAAVAVPAAVYLASLWLFHAQSERTRGGRLAAALAILGILLTPLTPQPVLGTGVLMAALVAFKASLAARPAHGTAR